jgi:uncharacterized membrane protein
MNKTRLEAFSDGVIAIIITIMVLELKIPEGTALGNIKPLVPKFLSYALSFLFIAIYWVNHHHLLHTLKKVTPLVMWANINLLFWLSLIPFLTGWMGENHFDKITVASYAALALLCGVSFNFLQAAIVKSIGQSNSVVKLITPTSWKNLISVIAYFSAIPIALYINPVISGILFFIVSCIWLIPDKKIEIALSE